MNLFRSYSLPSYLLSPRTISKQVFLFLATQARSRTFGTTQEGKGGGQEASRWFDTGDRSVGGLVTDVRPSPRRTKGCTEGVRVVADRVPPGVVHNKPDAITTQRTLRQTRRGEEGDRENPGTGNGRTEGHERGRSDVRPREILRARQDGGGRKSKKHRGGPCPSSGLRRLRRE